MTGRPYRFCGVCSRYRTSDGRCRCWTNEARIAELEAENTKLSEHIKGMHEKWYTEKGELPERLEAALAENERLGEALDKSIILGMDMGSPTTMHKSGGTIGNMFSEGIEEHNARIDAVRGERGAE